MNEEKVTKIKNGKTYVAVIISPEFGAGFVTWNDEVSPFEPKVVKMILNGKIDEITKEWCKKNLGLDVYVPMSQDFEVVWVEKGQRFSINEYDGSESLYIEDELKYKA